MATYTLTASAKGCTQMDTVNIEVLPYKSPVIELNAFQTICLGDSITIGTVGKSGNKYAWLPVVNLSDPNNSQPFAFPKQTTNYILTVTDTFSNYLCKVSSIDSTTIIVDDCNLILPNAFTPNGDGINDELLITNLPLESSLIIYNRWGLEIINYKLEDKSRDGRNYAGMPCIEGIYYYIVSLPNGKIYKNSLQLTR